MSTPRWRGYARPAARSSTSRRSSPTARPRSAATTRVAASTSASSDRDQAASGEDLGDRCAGGDLGPRLHHLAGQTGAHHRGHHAVAFEVGQEFPPVVLDQAHPPPPPRPPPPLP